MIPSSDTLRERENDLRTSLLHFINDELPQMDRRNAHWTAVQADTALFASGLLDSLSILHLIAAVEFYSGRPVPDEMVVMTNFQTVNAMAAAFSKP